jgi:O-antigen/teichoic acid export membrane protein
VGSTARDAAYLCFLGVGAAVAVLVLADVAGHHLPGTVGEAVVVLVLAPLTVTAYLAGLAGMGLTVWERYDLRLWALSVVTATLFVFWVRHGALGVSPRLSILHTAGAVLFSARWIAEKRAGRRADGPEPDE